MEEVWYRDGLRFTCTQCGHCCTGEPGYVWVSPAEASRLAAFLDISERAFRRRYLRRARGKLSLVERANGDCVFYNRGCTVYPVRPSQCRSYPFWSENLVDEASWKETERECPGSGVGRLYTVEEIERIRHDELDGTTPADEARPDDG